MYYNNFLLLKLGGVYTLWGVEAGSSQLMGASC